MSNYHRLYCRSCDEREDTLCYNHGGDHINGMVDARQVIEQIVRLAEKLPDHWHISLHSMLCGEKWGLLEWLAKHAFCNVVVTDEFGAVEYPPDAPDATTEERAR